MMIPIFGTRKRLCDGITRRDLLHIGGLGAFGLGLADRLGLPAAEASPAGGGSKFGQAKACILLYKYGAPSQLETFDPKPDAPENVRGVMKAISTAVPGIQICEGLPETAQIMDRLTVVRSLVHPFPLHGTVYATTGIPAVDTKIEALPRDKRQWPYIGSIVDYLADQRAGGKLPAMPRNIAMPYVLGSRANYPPLAGPYGAFLGTKYDPVVTEFEKKEGILDAPSITGGVYKDPFLRINPTDRLQLSKAGQLPPEVPGGRFDLRRTLLRQFDQQRAWMERDERVETYNHQKAMAASLLTSSKVRSALDVQQEPRKVRDRYGMHLFGQSTLAARRLVEAGTQFVTVFWDAFGKNGGSWDTHDNQHERLTKLLLPGFDQAFSALVLDLESRGMLDDTLIVCISEHGRTPKMSGTGRGHWSRAYSSVYAGGGMGRGNLVGKTDSIAGDVIDTPISPKDVLATAFHLLGIDPDTTVPDALKRPKPITGTGKFRREFLG